MEGGGEGEGESGEGLEWAESRGAGFEMVSGFGSALPYQNLYNLRRDSRGSISTLRINMSRFVLKNFEHLSLGPHLHNSCSIRVNQQMH